MKRRTLLLLALTLGATACRRGGAAPLPELGPVGDFSLVDQEGRPVTAARFAGKPYVAAFMFTRCPSVCPRMTARMKQVQARARDRGQTLQLVSFSVDPEHDTPAVLRQYAADHGVELSHWTFLTGDAAQIKRAALEGFKLALEGQVDPSKDHFGLLHSSFLVLVDGAGRLRGYYRTTDDTIDQLLSDLERLERPAQ